MTDFHMDQVIRRSLTSAPQLLTAYLQWVNRGWPAARRRLTVAVALLIAWILVVSAYLRVDRAAGISLLAWLQRHAVLLAGASALVASILVSRRRALNKRAISRSWTASLPVERSTAKWQVVAIESAPALAIAGLLATVFGSLTTIALFRVDMPAPISTWAAMTGGVVLGTALSYWIPAPKQEEGYELSRYVPYRRRAGTRIPIGSLSALESWPIRQMFAGATPKTVARATLPIILLMPMGSTADVAMLVMGLLAVMGMLLLLVTAVIAVSAEATRWLQPLPVGSGLMARKILIRPLALMLCATSIESWLLWVLGMTVSRCIRSGVIIVVVSAVFAATGSIFTISRKARNGR
jgi:hypothetical protein